MPQERPEVLLNIIEKLRSTSSQIDESTPVVALFKNAAPLDEKTRSELSAWFGMRSELDKSTNNRLTAALRSFTEAQHERKRKPMPKILVGDLLAHSIEDLKSVPRISDAFARVMYYGLHPEEDYANDNMFTGIDKSISST